MATRVLAQDYPDITPTGAPGNDYENIPTSPAMFGGLVAQGAEKLGQGTEAASQNAFSLTKFYQDTDADAATNAFNKSQLNRYYMGVDGKPAYFSLKGYDATAALPKLQTDVEADRQQFSQNLSPYARQQYEIATRRSALLMAEQAGRHADDQYDKGAVQTATDKENLAAQNVGTSWNNDKVFEDAKVQAAQAVGARLRVTLGNSATADDFKVANEQAYSKLVEARVNGQLNFDPKGATQFLNDEFSKGDVDPATYDRLLSRLRPMNAAAAGDAAVKSAPTVKESAGGGTIGDHYNNPGNIGYGDWAAKAGGTEGTVEDSGHKIAVFPSLKAGYDAMAKLASEKYSSGLTTPMSFITTPGRGWTPNNAVAAQNLAGYMGIGVNDDMHLNTPEGMKKLQYALSRQEGTLASWNKFSSGQGGASSVQPGLVLGPSSSPVQPSDVAASPTPAASSAPAPDESEYGLPDRGEMVRIAREQAGGDLIQARMNVAEANRRYSELASVTYAQRYQLEQEIPSLMAAAQAGVSVDGREQDIRQAFPRAKADGIIQNLRTSQQVGSILKGSEFASPQELGEMQGDLSSGLGVLSDAIHPNRHGPSTGPGTVAPSGIQGSPEEFKIRALAAAKLQQDIQRRNEILVGPSADPAAYAATHPAIRAAAAAIDPKNPATFENYASVSLGLQKYLGVPDALQHVLTRGQAMNLSDQIEQSQDPKATFQQLQKQMGAAWPHAFADAVSLGKLPASYQAVQALDDPHDAALLSRTLAMEKPTQDGKPGKSVSDTVDTIGSKGESGRIRDAVRYAPELQRYATSIYRSGASPDQVEGILNSVQTLALAKRAGGDSPDASSAAAAALKSFFGKFEYMPNGGARVPADKFDAVTGNAQTLLGRLTPDALAVPTNFGQSGQPDRNEYTDVLKASPTWVTSPRSDALWLMDNGGRVVRTTDGKPFEVRFDATAPQASPPPQAGEGMGIGMP